MDHGKLLALDTPEALMRGAARQLDARPDHASPAAPAEDVELRGSPAVATKPRRDAVAQQVGRGRAGELATRPAANASRRPVRLYVDGDAPQLVAPAATLLAEDGLALTRGEIGTPTLEDVFIHLTGRALR